MKHPYPCFVFSPVFEIIFRYSDLIHDTYYPNIL